MKIRTQFLWLVLGIFIVPVCMVIGMVVIEYYRAPDRALIPGYREISNVSGADIDEADWEKLSKTISRLPSEVKFLVVGKDSVVLYSTMAEIAAGARMIDGAVMSLVRETGSQYLYQIDSQAKKDGKGFLVITRVMRFVIRDHNPFLNILRTILAVFLVVLAFSAIMSFVIARSITQSVMLLEESTRRIAAGELDLAIEAKGSNEITSLTTSLNRMRLALKEEQTRRSRFIMGVSHDLKTPLSLIKGYTEAISDGLVDDPEQMKKSLGIVGTKVDQLEQMIDDLIGFVKLDTGEWRQQLREVRIVPVLNDFARRMSSDGNLLNRRIEYSIDLPENLLVRLDERLFLRALENILTNAIRYTPKGGLVRIDSRMDGPDVLVSVSDNGIGISAEDLPRIFDLFYRGTNSRREEGMGLGLSVVKSVCDSHSWQTTVSSEPGKLTTFTIRMKR